MSTTICFDFGNTRLKAAVFEQDQLKEMIILPDDNPSTVEELIQKYKLSLKRFGILVGHVFQPELTIGYTYSFVLYRVERFKIK